MTATNYARLKKSADRTIGTPSQLGAVRRTGEPTGPAYDPTPGVEVDYPARFVVLDYKDSQIDGTRILATDKYVILAVGDLPITLSLDDKLVEADGTVYKIIPPLKPLSPAGVVVLFEVQARV